jgi:hypothetical protein
MKVDTGFISSWPVLAASSPSPSWERAIAFGISSVMAGLVPAIHVLATDKKGVDARDKPGHDEFVGSIELPNLQHTSGGGREPTALLGTTIVQQAHDLP